MSERGKRSAVRRQVDRFTPEKVYDDPVRKDYKPEIRMDLHGKVVADLFGRTVYRSDADDPSEVPSASKWDRVRERVREECVQEATEQKLQEAIPSAAKSTLEVYLAFIDWEAAMLEDGGCTDDESFAVGAFLLPTPEGKLERAVDGWPIHGSYHYVRNALHAWCPTRFRNGNGAAMYAETAKGRVLNGLSKKLWAYVEHRVPGTWTRDEIKAQLERKFGDDTHRVPHKC